MTAWHFVNMQTTASRLQTISAQRVPIMQHGFRACRPGKQACVCLQVPLLALLLGVTVPVLSVWGDSGYYRTLMPPLPPPAPIPENRTGGMQPTPLMRGGCTGRVRKMVVLADEPRQAALAALRNPVLGVTMASHALAAGRDAERAGLVTCVDLYFEGVTFSWNFLKCPSAAARPEYPLAWQLYHHSLARLISSAQRFGRLDPAGELQVVTAMGLQTIPTSYRGFVWKPADFTRVEVVANSQPKELQRHYRTPGLGVPLVVIREGSDTERFLNRQTPFNATAVLRPSLAAIAGQAPPFGTPSSHGPLEFHDPLRVTDVEFNGRHVAMATNTSAALEYMLRQDEDDSCVFLLCPESAEAEQEKLFMIEPYQRGKFPVVFAPGLFPSRTTWAEFANEILARRQLRSRIQLMAYRYSPSRPILEAAAGLRRELLALKDTYDPEGDEPGIANTAVVGHGIGGLVAKLVATYSDDRLWYSIARRPLHALNASAEKRTELHEQFYFEPVPFVRRVVFVGTPHNGTQLASRTVAGWTAARAQLPRQEQIEHDLLIKQNPGTFTPEVADRMPSSLDLTDRNSCLLQTIKVLCPGPNVQLHNIIGVGSLSPLSGRGDGVVSCRSAQHHSVSTEKQVHANRCKLHRSDETTKELVCILTRHILEANDVPSLDGYDCAEPARGLPSQPTSAGRAASSHQLKLPASHADEPAPQQPPPTDPGPRSPASSDDPSPRPSVTHAGKKTPPGNARQQVDSETAPEATPVDQAASDTAGPASSRSSGKSAAPTPLSAEPGTSAGACEGPELISPRSQ